MAADVRQRHITSQALLLVVPLLMMTMMTMITMTVSVGSASSSKCLVERPEILPKRRFFFNSSSLSIKIETSNRPSHQLVSRVLRILLTEVLGYSKVDLLEGYNSMDTHQILNRISGNSSKIPETMVNLEIWVRSGFNLEALVSRGSLVNAGPLGPSGRFGWFIPQRLVEVKWNSSHISLDHWKALRLPAVTSLFSYGNVSEGGENVTSCFDNLQGRSYCEAFRLESGGSCHGGVYYSPRSRCLHGNSTCAVLLSSFPDLNGKLLQHQIMNLDLNVGIVWLGDYLNAFVRNEMERGFPVLFYNWIPNELTSSSDVTRMLFPACQNSGKPPENCDFEIHQLSKMVWATIKSHTPEAFHLISRMELTQTELSQLLVNYQERPCPQPSVSATHCLEQAACAWVRANEWKWKGWIPENLSSKTPIYLGGMFPLTGPYWRQPGIIPGAVMAVEYINSDDSILPDYELILLVQDTQCKVDIAMAQFLQYVVNKTHPIAGILGPGCSETAEPIAGVSKHFNTIVISYSAEAVQLTNRIQFPLFFRTIPHILQNGVVYVDLFRHWGWEQVALLAEDGQGYPEYHMFLKDLFLSRSIQVIYDRKMPRQSKMEDAAKHIDELKRRNARIIILTSFEQAARAVICEAFLKGVTASNGFVWFLPSWFTQNWWDTDMYNQHPLFSEKVPCSSEQMKVAVQGHFFLNTAYLGHLDSRIVGNMTVSQWQQAYVKRMMELRKQSSAYASYAYDAVLVFALSLHQLLTQDPSSLESLRTDRTVQRLMYYLNNTHFSGASGPVQFSGADRTGIINIHQQGRESTVLVGQFSPDSSNLTNRLLLNDSLVVWLTKDGPPTDGTQQPKKCSIEGFRLLLGVECDSALVVANVIGIGIFIILMIICLVGLKKWYDRQVDKMKRKMDPYQLLEKLNEWQIPRDKIVLNRKIGEGTSGKVYGGEANINGTWVAVAVKTLKNCATIEEKMDFLGEAEMMKEFDHRNIVKLLGVCTMGDPIYMIMEFMLHGDLKTFLLARRHMVGQTSVEADDVRPHSLTKMALDVANGLKYLSSLNYVHRDLACRNCLIDSNKTVLIGDFGMTKCMFDKDYYQLNRKGKFPVRWMAPESLSDGRFTMASDIWSYGVLLYEVMTFGSIPFPGHSNKDVLELVRNGKKIEIPNTCSANVKYLLLNCWEFSPEKRPSINEIVNLLEGNPDLIEPCIDAPSSAIAIDTNTSHGVNIMPNFKSRTWRERLTSEHMRGFSLSSQDVGSKASDEEYSPEANILDPFCALKWPSAPSKDPPRKMQDMNHRQTRFSLDSFRKSTKLVRSVSSDERACDGKGTVSELRNGCCCEIEPQVSNNSTRNTISLKSRANLRSVSSEGGGCEEEMLMCVPPSIESKVGRNLCNHHEIHLTDAERLPYV